MLVLLLFFGVPAFASVLLALLPALAQRSWRRFFIALGLTFVAVVLPLFFFFLSALMVPGWKGACLHGWVDCFILGKLALAPLALLAGAALYSSEVLRLDPRAHKWIVVGIFLGAVVSIVCLVFGLTCLKFDSVAEMAFMLVPFYTALWYSIRAAQMIKASGVGIKTCLNAVLVSVPFWIGSVLWSECSYAALPNQAPDCFIVTAAGRGHRKFVGPFFKIQRRGRRLEANQQLITLWQFENLWRDHSPLSHRHFRRYYNRFGPVIAAQIRSPWAADLAYLAIKPVEWVAQLAIRPSQKEN